MQIKKLQSELKKNKIDVAIFFSLDEKPNTSVQYFAGYSGLGILAVTKTNHFLLVPEMEYEKAIATKLNVLKTDKKRHLLALLKESLKKNKIVSVGVEENKCTVDLYKKTKKFVKGKYNDITEIISIIRMKKESFELDNLKRACGVTDAVFSKICKNFNFKTEGELKKFIVSEIEKHGCELAFPPIVASGKGTSQAHYESDNKIVKGFLMLDFGAKYKGYCSDMTRMLYIGKPSKEEIHHYNVVLNTLIDCERESVSLEKFEDLYGVAIKILGDDSEFFTHALGHGLGLDIHERPNLSPNETLKISDNIPFTIEPGVYFEGKYGIRIEDTVVIQRGKLDVLTKSKKGLVIL